LIEYKLIDFIITSVTSKKNAYYGIAMLRISNIVSVTYFAPIWRSADQIV